jgi:hypothetical protein
MGGSYRAEAELHQEPGGGITFQIGQIVSGSVWAVACPSLTNSENEQENSDWCEPQYGPAKVKRQCAPKQPIGKYCERNQCMQANVTPHSYLERHAPDSNSRHRAASALIE